MHTTMIDAHPGRGGTEAASVGAKDFAARIGEQMRPLNQYALWLMRDRAAAQDVVQETLLRAWRSRHTLEKSEALAGWLRAILRHESARHCRRDRAGTSRFPVEELGDSRRSYDTSTEAFVVRQALARLPRTYRDPLLMQVVDGYSLAEIARRLDLSEAGAGTRLFRARQRLRELIGERGEG